MQLSRIFIAMALRSYRIIPFTFAATISLGAQTASLENSSEASFRLYATDVIRVPKENWTGTGVYLGNGLVLTAGHVAGSFIHTVRVEIAGEDLATNVIKRGRFSESPDDVDLALLEIDEAKLPVWLRLRRMPICHRTPLPGEQVVVATPHGIAASHIIAPSALPKTLNSKFATAIADVAKVGNSGSGVFDPSRGCLMGIISAKITTTRIYSRGPIKRQPVDIAKYFVPSSVIEQFIPPQYRF